MYEIYTEKETVRKIIVDADNYSIVRLSDGSRGFNYKNLTGPIAVNDEVIVNTTAVELGLGTGGYHFVIFNLTRGGQETGTGDSPGHIMKMRYTPFQVKTYCVEEPVDLVPMKFDEISGLDGKIVVLLPLHSLLAPLAVVFKNFYPERKLVYIMSEGGSLALEFSHLVRELCDRGIIDSTITPGHCFGGDLECVNIFTALLAADKIKKADLIVTGMGPGMTGTGTSLGFSGVESAFINYAVEILGGHSLLVPRISFRESRSRHFLLSHHTLTLLGFLIDSPVEVILPALEVIRRQVIAHRLPEKHRIFYYRYKNIEKILKESSISFTSMGRSFRDDPLFFITGGLPVLRYREIMKER